MTGEGPRRDLDRFVALVRSRETGKPLFLFGHSLGGLVTALYAIERRPEVADVVLSAPGIAFDLPVFGAGAIRFTGRRGGRPDLGRQLIRSRGGSYDRGGGFAVAAVAATIEAAASPWPRRQIGSRRRLRRGRGGR